MSLDIGLAASKTTTPYPSMSVALEDDGAYWFCHPYFEDLAEITGEMIDLYGGAWFTAGSLDALAATLGKIRANTVEMTESWQVCVGGLAVPSGSNAAPQAIFAAVGRSHLLGLLTKLDALVVEARRDGKWIACLGD